MPKNKKEVKKDKFKVIREIKSDRRVIKSNKDLEEEINEKDIDLEKFEDFIMQETPLVSRQPIIRDLPSNQPIEVLERDVGTGFIGRNEEENEDSVKYANESSQYVSGRNNENGANNGYRTMADEGTMPVIEQGDSSKGESAHRRGIGFSNPDFEKIQNYVHAEEQDATKYHTGVGVANVDEERERVPGERRRKNF